MSKKKKKKQPLTQESLVHDPPSPEGGVRSTAYYQDKDGDPVDKAKAARVEIIVWDEGGNVVARYYGTI